MRCFALEIANPFVASEVTRPQAPEKPFDIPLSTDVLTLFDIGKLRENQLIDDEVAHWLTNSSATGNETTTISSSYFVGGQMLQMR
jgi:hypothetical protein